MKIEFNPIPFFLGFVFTLAAWLISGSAVVAGWVLLAWLIFVIGITVIMLMIR